LDGESTLDWAARKDDELASSARAAKTDSAVGIFRFDPDLTFDVSE
jgi:hypothetical protein